MTLKSTKPLNIPLGEKMQDSTPAATAGGTSSIRQEPTDLASVRRQKKIEAESILSEYGETGEISGLALATSWSDSPVETIHARREVHASPDFLEVMRAYLAKPILDALDEVQDWAGSPSAAVHVNAILHGIRKMEDHSPDDPFLRILFALYDALAFDNNWTDCTAKQYGEAKAVLERFSKLAVLKAKDVERAITALKRIGFDTMPFTLDENVQT